MSMSTATRVDPGLHREMALFGASDLGACMSCGRCTASCALANGTEAFPRKLIHQLQVGNRTALAASLDPWLCYYCGECTKSCPRDADPAGIMMAARRWLTARYDTTGLGHRFYTSPLWQMVAMTGLAVAVVVAFLVWHGPVVRDHVALNAFAPVRVIELADWIMAGALGVLLLGNAWRMIRLAMRFERPPLQAWLRAVPSFFLHFSTQKRWRSCEVSSRRWLRHFLLVTSYVIMLLMVVVGLRWFQTDKVYPWFYPTRILGYYATVIMLWVSVEFFLARLRAEEPVERGSETSDWLFLILLFLVALTGILVHVFRLAGAPLTTYTIYVIHLALVAPFLIVEVPFGKWSHMLYRPLAIYLSEVKRRADEAAATPAAT